MAEEIKNQKLLVAPAEKSETPKELKLLFKSLSALLSFILGFNFSRSAFFKEYPLFGVNYLAEVVISVFAAAIGFIYIPMVLVQLRHAVESYIINTVSDIVSSFWDMQSKRIQEQRRIKQKKKSDDSDQKFLNDIKDGVLVDTSVLIDGRIIKIVSLGFLENPLIILNAVVKELHLLSDNSDTLKRQKGRRGLDTLKDLKKKTKTIFTENPTIKSDKVDDLLIEFAKQHKVKIATLDFNLSKVASVGNIKVLNINELVNAVKTPLLPGEDVTIKIIHPGKDTTQGVGYLSDGTMLVVENAGELVGSEVSARVTKVIQSSAGKMIFSQIQ